MSGYGWLRVIGVMGFLAFSAQADEKSDLIAKQKKTIEENLKKIQIDKPTIIETDHLFVTGTLSEDRLKALAVSAQKYYAAAYKALKFEMADSMPKGKFALYVFPERAKYTAFFRGLERSVEKDERSHSEPRADEPYVAVTLPLGETKGNLESEAGAAVASALLTTKGGPAALPRWMLLGFGKAIQMRVEPTVFDKDRREIRRMLGTGGKKPGKDVKTFALKDAWDADETPERLLLSASLLDYFVYGPESAKFGKLVSSFRVSDDVPNPTIETAMKSAEFTPEMLEKTWKKWVASGK